MAKIVITNGTIHSDDDFNLTSGSDANTRNNFRICKQKDSHTRLRSLSSFRIKTHDLLNTGNAVVCGNLTVHGTCTVLNTTLCLTDTTTQDNFIIESTDAGATSAPDFKLYRNSASPANSDTLGHIKFTGKDAAGNETDYASIRGQVQTVTSGGECGVILGDVTINGSSTDIIRVDYAGLWTQNSKNLYLNGSGQLRNYGACLRLSTGGGAYDIQFEPNSVLKARLNPDGILFVCGKVDTPILKASSCTHYGACTSSKLTSSGDNMAHTTQYGVICFGPGNSSYAHIQTDRSQFYFNKQLVVDSGHVLSYNEDLKLSRAGNSVNAIYIGSATTTSCNPTKLFSQQGHGIPQTGNAVCWLKFGAICIPQHGYKMRMKVVASNGYGSSTTDTTQETTLLFQTANASEASSGSSVCACVHSFIEGSTKSESDAPYCFIVHEVNSALFEIFGKFNTYTGVGSYYTIDSAPNTCWIACNSFVDPDSCSGSCIVSIPNRGTIFCTSSSITCICGSAHVVGDICMNNGSRGYKLGTDTAGSGSRAFLVLDRDGSDGIGAGSDYALIAKDGGDTKIYNDGPEHIRLCSSSCVAFCKPIIGNCISATTRLQSNVIRNQTGNLYLNVYSGCNDSAAGGIYFRSCGGTSRGYVYFDGTSNFGLLNCAGTWSLKIVGDQSGTIHSCSVHCFQKNIGLAGGSASRVCIGGSRAIEGNSGILSLGEDFTSICLRAGCTYSNAPMYIGGKVSVGTATCPPEVFGVCGNGMRIAHSAGNPVLYFGTSYSSVDIALQRAGADALYFKYYEGGWCNSFLLNKGCTKSCICHESPVLCATGCVKTPLIQAQGGKSCFSAPAAAADDWACSALHIRERGEVSAAQSHCCYAPNINFHWGGRVSNSLWMDAVGNLNWGSYNSNGCPDTNGNCRFNTGILYGETCVLGPILCATSCVKSPVVCGTTCLASPIIAGTGSAVSDYGALQIQGNKGGYGGVHFCGYTFMAASDCGGGGIYNDTHNQWVIWNSANSATYIYHAGNAKLHTSTNGIRVCKESNGGYIDICPSGSWGHLITSNNCFYFNKPVIVDGGRIASYDEDLTLGRGAALTAAETIKITSGTTHICQLTKVHGNLCVTGQVCADGMEGDTLSCATVCTGTICFNTGCVTGYDAVYDVYVSANPNCGGSTIYRDIVHMSVYVTTGWNGSAVTKYINHVNNFVRGAVHDSGGSTVTAVPKLLVGTTGCECYAAACATCLQIQVAGGSNQHNTCVKIKRVL